MARYWSDVFTPETWEETRNLGFRVLGFREAQARLVQRMRPGDFVLCYLKGASAFCGVLRVEGAPYVAETPRHWSSDAFPSRVPTEPIVVLDERMVAFVDIADRLRIARGLPPKARTGSLLQGSPKELPPEDGALIAAELERAAGAHRTRGRARARQLTGD